MSDEPRDITDLRPELSVVVTTKEVVPHQLAAELGIEEVWTDPPTNRVIANVPQSVLEAAIATHTADQAFGEPPEERGLWALRARAQLVWNDPATTTFTQQQLNRLVAGLVLMAIRRLRRDP
jgi:hypothetical protein